MVQVNSITTEQYVFDYRTQGVEKVKADVDKLGASLDKLSGSQAKATDSEGKASASSEKAAQAKARYEERVARAQRAIEMEARAMEMARAAQDAAAGSMQGLSDAQVRFAQAAAKAAAQQQAASNDNVQALEKQSSAYKEAGKFALEHPLLVISGSVLAARALSTMAGTAGTALGAASLATARFAEGSTAMGGAVASGGTVAARGLAVAGEAATAIAGALAAYAARAAGATTAVGLLTRGLGLIPGLFGPIGAAFAAFQLGSMAISKAGDDLDRLIALGEKARGLDLSAPFVKEFEGLGQKIEATTEQMDKALQQASGFVKDRYGQANSALSAVSSLYTAGAFGAEKPAAMSALETATTTQEKVQATLDAIKELQARGQEFAALDLTEKLFGPEVADRIRTGQASISQIVADLQSAADKEVLKQEQVSRALELNKNIADTKQAISDAVAVTFDFSGAAMAANQAWLMVLQTILSIIQKINDANQASSDFVGTATTTIINGFKTAGAAAADWLAKNGIIEKQAAAAESEALQLKVTPKITGRSFPYTFGPGVEDLPKATNAAKQAGQAAQQAASSYDLLIKRTGDRIDELNLEADSVGKTTDAVIKLKLAHDLERAAQKDGTEVTQAMREEWDRLGDRLAASTSRLAENRRAFELLKDGQRELADGFTSFVDDIVLGGQKMEQAFASLSKSLSSSVLKGLISGEGPLAGILGTAAKERGQLGGLLGGNLFSDDSAARSPLPGAQGPTMEASGLRSIFNTDKIASALGLGAETGLGSAVSGWLKESRQGGGILTSPLGQGLTSIAAGASVGYSSQSPLMGGISGALAGAMTANPLLAVAGAGAGAIGSIPSSKKDRRHVARQRLRDLA